MPHTPDVPAYGEDDEAAALSHPATVASAAAKQAAAKIPPPGAPVESHGTTETDVARNLALTAARNQAQT